MEGPYGGFIWRVQEQTVHIPFQPISDLYLTIYIEDNRLISNIPGMEAGGLSLSPYVSGSFFIVFSTALGNSKKLPYYPLLSISISLFYLFYLFSI